MTETGEWKDATTAGANDEWQDVDAEFQIILEMEGEGFIGRYLGMDPPNANGIVQSHWTTVLDLAGESIADDAFYNTPTDLRNKLKKVPTKAIVRVQWESSMDTGHESGNKMRVFKVQWKR